MPTCFLRMIPATRPIWPCHSAARSWENRLSQQLCFFDLELMNLADDRFDALCALPDARELRPFPDRHRKFRPYTLKEKKNAC